MPLVSFGFWASYKLRMGFHTLIYFRSHVSLWPAAEVTLPSICGRSTMASARNVTAQQFIKAILLGQLHTRQTDERSSQRVTRYYE